MELPYDPSLYLGCIVSQQALKRLIQTSTLNAEIKQKKDKVTALKNLKIEMEMLKHDIPSDIIKDDEKDDVNELLKDAQKEYYDTAVEKLKAISELEVVAITSSVESPIDWTKSELRSDLPIAADTMKCTAQWFMVDDKSGGAEKHSSDVGAHIESSFGAMGCEIGANAKINSKKNQESLNDKGKICSTLVITCHCTHKNARTFSPLVFDLKKLVAAWNETFQKNKIDVKKIYKYKDEKEAEEKLEVVTGAIYSSGLSGTVNFVDEKGHEEEADSSEFESKVDVKIATLGKEATFGAHYNDNSDVANMMANRKISVHFDLYCAGVIPNLETQTINTNVKMLAQLDNKNLKGKIGAIVEALQNNDSSESSVLNVKTMMNAFDNYITLASTADQAIGVPSNYLTKPIYRRDIIDMLMEEHEIKLANAWKKNDGNFV